MTAFDIHQKPGLAKALSALDDVDRDLARAVERLGVPEPRVHRPGFATLLRIIVSQQVSTQSANAIWGRLEKELQSRIDPRSFLAIGEAGWRRAGLSRPKMRYAQALAEAVAVGRFSPPALARMNDAQAIEAITSLIGFGRWSAEIYLLFALGRGDILPADDLAIQVGYQRLKELGVRPKAEQLRHLTASWSPYRGAAAIFLWHLYGAATLDKTS